MNVNSVDMFYGVFMTQEQRLFSALFISQVPCLWHLLLFICSEESRSHSMAACFLEGEILIPEAISFCCGTGFLISK